LERNWKAYKKLRFEKSARVPALEKSGLEKATAWLAHEKIKPALPAKRSHDGDHD
jgi:hypothetical protein